MFTISRKYGLWPLIGIVMKWGSQWCDFCVLNLLLTACQQPKRKHLKNHKNTKCSPFVESMGCDLSLESSWNDNCNDVIFVCLTWCWQPVGSRSTQIFAKLQKYQMFTVRQKYGLWPIIGIVMIWRLQWCDFCVFNLLLTACQQPKRANVCKITKILNVPRLLKVWVVTFHLNCHEMTIAMMWFLCV